MAGYVYLENVKYLVKSVWLAGEHYNDQNFINT